MKKHAYVIIPFFSFLGPMIMSFDEKVYFIQYLPAILVAIGIVGALYIIWDVIVTNQGHWSFNDEFVGKTRIAHLPLGEWLFFLLIPYAVIFIYEVVAAYFGIGEFSASSNWIQYLLAGLFVIPAIIWRKKGYTFLAMASSSIFFLVSAIITPGIITAPGYLLFLLFSFIVFVIVNGIYTSLPTIVYSEKAVLGPRVGSIPIEDFFYNLSYLGLTITVYILFKGVFGL
jgi:lycopene cyclase domain-containing protein